MPSVPANLRTAVERHPHLRRHLQGVRKLGLGPPDYHQRLDGSLKGVRIVNVVYPVGDPIFIHVYDGPDGERRYDAVEPRLGPADRAKYDAVRERLLDLAAREEAPEDPERMRNLLRKLLLKAVRVGGGGSSTVGSLLGALTPRVPVSKEELGRIRYFLEREILDSGPLEPIIRDPHIEDVHAIGTARLFVVHKIFDMVETNVRFADGRELDLFLRTMSERIGRPVSESRPIVDATLPDGSRINVIYSEDVSRRGSSFTIRKFSEVPTSITQVVKWGTLSARIAAYLWLCLENGMSVFVCGETASGKTTTVNAMLAFIRADSKVFTAEDTPEVRPPQRAWQQLVTRESGPEEGRVGMFDLLKAALRSRPNYIIVGEIRGVEGAIAFQAMQTGHPCIATFHASSVQKMIQRFSAPPINVPATFMDNLNVCLIQMAVHTRGRTLRRVLAVEEIEGYSDYAKGVLTRGVFQWDPVRDVHNFRGRNNSHVLENRIAKNLGYADRRKIYEDLDLRARVLEAMIANGVFEYAEVNRLIARFSEDGLRALPFPVASA